MFSNDFGGDRTLKFKKASLLEKIKENRESHRRIFLEALDGYRRKASAILENNLKDLRENRKISSVIKIPVPKDQTRQYDRVISMLENTIQDEIELTGLEYGRYVQDDWEWKEEFLISNATYSETARKMSQDWE